MRLKRYEIEQLEQESEPLLEEQQDAGEDLYLIAQRILRCFDLEDHSMDFIQDGHGLAILANCCNAAAKWFDVAFYELKPFLINLACARLDDCWQHDGIVYIETSIGQVSFHALSGEDKALPGANGRTWSGLPYQMNAPIVARAYVEKWSRSTLIEKIAEEEKK